MRKVDAGQIEALLPIVEKMRELCEEFHRVSGRTSEVRAAPRSLRLINGRQVAEILGMHPCSFSCALPRFVAGGLKQYKFPSCRGKRTIIKYSLQAVETELERAAKEGRVAWQRNRAQ